MPSTKNILSALLPNDGSLRVLSITWNMANKTPSNDDIQKILNEIPDNQRPVDLVIIAAQEEIRNDNQSLGKKIKDIVKPHNDIAHVASFNTFTEDFGRVSQTLISNHCIKFENSRCLQHATESYKFKNKGGLFTDITIGGHTLHAAAVHLESHNNVVRFEETKHIMHKMHRKIESYDNLVSHAKTATIFSGDLNTRNRTDKKNPTEFFDAFGLTQSSNLIGKFTYVGKGKPLTKANSDDVNKADAKRPGETKGGLLDQTLIQGNAQFESARIVEGTTTGDHKPVVTRIRIPCVKNDIEHTKQFLINEIVRRKMQYFIHSPDLYPHIDHLARIVDKTTESNKENLFTVYEHIKRMGRQLENVEKLKQMATRESDKAAQEKEIYAKRGFFGKLFFSDKSKQHEEQANKLNDEAREQLNSAYRILGWNIPILEEQLKEEGEAKAKPNVLPLIEIIGKIGTVKAETERGNSPVNNTSIPLSPALFSQPSTVAHSTGTPDYEQEFDREDLAAAKTPNNQW